MIRWIIILKIFEGGRNPYFTLHCNNIAFLWLGFCFDLQYELPFVVITHLGYLPCKQQREQIVEQSLPRILQPQKLDHSELFQHYICIYLFILTFPENKAAILANLVSEVTDLGKAAETEWFIPSFWKLHWVVHWYK